MKQLACEMCGSTDLLKQDGVFICQTCGCKYSVEEAKKMMIEGTVEVEGSVKIDESSKVEGFLTLGFLELKKLSNNARKYFDQVIELDPKNAKAWLGKAMAEFYIRDKEDLKEKLPFEIVFCDSFKKAFMFAENDFLEELKEVCYFLAIKLKDGAVLDIDYNKAAIYFDMVAGYKDADIKKEECLELARIAKENKEEITAKHCAFIKRANQHSLITQGVCSYSFPAFGITDSGNVLIIADEYDLEGLKEKYAKILSWNNISSLTITSEWVIGIKIDGKIVKHGNVGSDVLSWTNISRICEDGDDRLIGIKADGTVKVQDEDMYDYYGFDDNWRDLIKIVDVYGTYFGLSKQGKLVRTNNRDRFYDEQEELIDLSKQTNIIDIYFALDYLVLLKADGGVIIGIYRRNDEEQEDIDNINFLFAKALKWTNIQTITEGGDFIAGLKADGTVEIDGRVSYRDIQNVKKWRNIIAISANKEDKELLGVRIDGTILSSYGREIPFKLFDNVEEYLNTRDIVKEKYRKDIERLLEEKKLKERIAQEKQLQEEKLCKERELKRQKYRMVGVCQHCGGKFKGLFSKTCSSCGRKKDY